MACASDSSDSEERIALSRSRRSATKKVVSSTDSEEEDSVKQGNQTPLSMAGGNTRRRSERKRRMLHVPSREERWKAIHSEPTVTNHLSHLTPKKLINDFTKVTSRYNYDYAEVSGEESMEEFIKGSDCSESDSGDSHTDEGQKGHRVKGYRPRIAKLSESSDDDDDDDASQPNTQSKADTQPRILEKQQYSTRQKHMKPKALTFDDCSSKGSDLQCGKQSEDTPDKTGSHAKHLKKSRKASLLQSDSDDTIETPFPLDSSPHKETEKTKRQNVLSSDSDNQAQNSGMSSDEGSLKVKRKTTRKARSKSALDSDSDSEGNEAVSDTPDDKPQHASSGKDNDTVSDTPDEKPQCASSSKDNANAPGHHHGQTPTVLSTHSCGSKVHNTVDEEETSNREKRDTGDCTSRETDAILITSSDSESGDSATAEDDSADTSSDNTQYVGRIQKLAAQKRKKKDSMFDQLKSSRAKRQKQI